MFLLWRKHASVIKMLQRAHREFCASRAGPPQCQGSRRIFLLLDTERPRNKSLVGAASPCAPRRWPDALKSRTLGSSIHYFLAAARFSIVGSAPIWVVSLPAALEKAVMFPLSSSGTARNKAVPRPLSRQSRAPQNRRPRRPWCLRHARARHRYPSGRC